MKLLSKLVVILQTFADFANLVIICKISRPPPYRRRHC